MFYICIKIRQWHHTTPVSKNGPFGEYFSPAKWRSGVRCCFWLKLSSDLTLHKSCLYFWLKSEIRLKSETAPHPWSLFAMKLLNLKFTEFCRCNSVKMFVMQSLGAELLHVIFFKRRQRNDVPLNINSLWLSDAIWRHLSWYLNQC